MNNRKLLVVLTAVLVGGCASARAMKHWRETLDPLVGQKQDAVLLRLGPPTERAAADSIEVWRYYRSYGVNTEEDKNLFTGKSLGSSTSYPRYDDIKVFFKNGAMTHWTGDVRR